MNLNAKFMGLSLVVWLIAIAAFIPFNYDGTKEGVLSRILSSGDHVGYPDSPYYSTAGADYKVSMSLTSITSGVTENDDDPNHIILTVEDGDLNNESLTNLGFTVNLDRTDKISDQNSAYPVYQVRPVVGSAGFQSYTGYATTSTTYYTGDYSTTTGYWNLTVGGASVALSNAGYSTPIQVGTTDTTAVTFYVDDYTTLDAEYIQTTWDSKTIGAFEVVAPSNAVVATVEVIYIK